MEQVLELQRRRLEILGVVQNEFGGGREVLYKRVVTSGHGEQKKDGWWCREQNRKLENLGVKELEKMLEEYEKVLATQRLELEVLEQTVIAGDNVKQQQEEEEEERKEIEMLVESKSSSEDNDNDNDNDNNNNNSTSNSLTDDRMTELPPPPLSDHEEEELEEYDADGVALVDEGGLFRASLEDDEDETLEELPKLMTPKNSKKHNIDKEAESQDDDDDDEPPPLLENNDDRVKDLEIIGDLDALLDDDDDDDDDSSSVFSISSSE